MSGHEFKLGDRVRCVDPDNSELNAGEIYEVVATGSTRSGTPTVSVAGRMPWFGYYAHRFDLAERPEPVWEVGDEIELRPERRYDRVSGPWVGEGGIRRWVPRRMGGRITSIDWYGVCVSGGLDGTFVILAESRRFYRLVAKPPAGDEGRGEAVTWKVGDRVRGYFDYVGQVHHVRGGECYVAWEMPAAPEFGSIAGLWHPNGVLRAIPAPAALGSFDGVHPVYVPEDQQ